MADVVVAAHVGAHEEEDEEEQRDKRGGESHQIPDEADAGLHRVGAIGGAEFGEQVARESGWVREEHELQVVGTRAKLGKDGLGVRVVLVDPVAGARDDCGGRLEEVRHLLDRKRTAKPADDAERHEDGQHHQQKRERGVSYVCQEPAVVGLEQQREEEPCDHRRQGGRRERQEAENRPADEERKREDERECKNRRARRHHSILRRGEVDHATSVAKNRPLRGGFLSWECRGFGNMQSVLGIADEGVSPSRRFKISRRWDGPCLP